MDYLLKTGTEQQMDDALEAAGLLHEVDIGDGELVLLPVMGVAVDLIGDIPGASGFHANIRVDFDLTSEVVARLPLVVPTPVTPYRVFL